MKTTTCKECEGAPVLHDCDCERCGWGDEDKNVTSLKDNIT